MKIITTIALSLALVSCQTTSADKNDLESKKLVLASPEAMTLGFDSVVAYDFDTFFSTEGNVALRAAQWEADVQNHPDRTPALLQLAYLKFEQGKYDQFNTLMDLATKRVTTDSMSYLKFASLYLQGLALERKGFQQKSRLIYRDLTEVSPKFVPGYIHLSMSYLKNVKPDVAKFIISSGLEANPRDPRLLNALGLVHKSMGDNEIALDWFNQALTLNPDLVDALINRATMYLEKEQYDDAKVDLEKALKKSPQNSEGLMLMAIIAINAEGDTNKGKHLLGQAIQSNPSKQIAKMRLAEVYIQEKRELGFARKLLMSIINDKSSQFGMIESAKNYLEMTK